MAKMAGYKVLLQIDSNVITGYRTAEMDATADMAEKTTGASTNQWKEYEPMFKGMEMTLEGLYDPTGNEDFDGVYDLLAAGTQCTARYGGSEAGDTYWTASAYISHVHISGDYTDLASYTIDVIIDGEPTKATVGA